MAVCSMSVTDLAKVVREFLLVLNHMSEAALQSKVHGEVGQAPGNLKTETNPVRMPPQNPSKTTYTASIFS